MAEIAHVLGVSRKTTYNIERRAMRQLRLAFGCTDDDDEQSPSDMIAA